LDDIPLHQEHAIRPGRTAASATIWQWRSAQQQTPRTIAARLRSLLNAFIPGVIRRALDALVNVIVRLVTWIVLRALFYGVFVPLGWLVRTKHSDPMQRSSEAARTSYWSDRSDGQKRRGEHVASAKRARQY
jgi:hypothetical protein